MRAMRTRVPPRNVATLSNLGLRTARARNGFRHAAPWKLDRWTITRTSLAYTKMRAAVITRPGGPEVLEIREVDRPTIAPDGVLVRVRASAINRADLMQRRGAYPAPADSPRDIPGIEYAGEVA